MEVDIRIKHPKAKTKIKKGNLKVNQYRIIRNLYRGPNCTSKKLLKMKN